MRGWRDENLCQRTQVVSLTGGWNHEERLLLHDQFAWLDTVLPNCTKRV
jgi:hypothetical protein